MPTFRTVRHVPYTPEAMLELVADVERYPEFLPLCESLKVLSRKREPDGAEIIVARMGVGYGPIHETFTSRVEIARTGLQIQVSYLDGPFRRLENTWSFRASGNGCDVDFHIDYEFRSIALQLLLGAMFDRAFRKFAEAFETRARKVYGTSRTVVAVENVLAAKGPALPSAL